MATTSVTILKDTIISNGPSGKGPERVSVGDVKNIDDGAVADIKSKGHGK